MEQPKRVQKSKIITWIAASVGLVFCAIVVIAVGRILFGIVDSFLVPDTPKRISGTYSLQSRQGDQVTGQLIIRPDGTFTQTVCVPGQPTKKLNSKWSFRGPLNFQVHFDRLIIPEGEKWLEMPATLAPYFGPQAYEIWLVGERYYYMKPR